MRRITFGLAVVFLFASVLTAQVQETRPVLPVSTAAASLTQAECTGFIAETPVPRDLVVVGGGDDDFHSVVRQFVKGESVFISPRKGGDITVGAEYNVIRPAKELFQTTRYQGQRGDMRKLGNPYEDVAKVKVTHVNPQGAVAEVTFSCGPIIPGDALMPFQPRAIPEYTVSQPLDHFSPLDKNKTNGRITATHNNFGFLGAQTVVYLNLGERDGTAPGRRFRIYKVLPPEATGFLTKQRTPPETVGEAVVLSVHPKSCVAMVVSSYREISAGDYVEAE
jgi:hypothetical protein